MHRFFVDRDQLSGLMVRFSDDQAHQIGRVLRLRPGGSVLILDGHGLQYHVVLEEVAGVRVSGIIASQGPATGEPSIRLTLFQSLLRREKFEWVLQKGTEIGVSTFVPVITSRSLLRDGDDVKPERLDRWRRVIKEAAEQSGRGALPRLLPPLPYEAAVLEGSKSDCSLIAWEGVHQTRINEALAHRREAQTISLFIGPEGGYDPTEIDSAVEYGIIPITLGRRILRTETAAVVGAALVLYELGQMD
jgi:16S rRNA (uracil1498-N3)-methyltransferase